MSNTEDFEKEVRRKINKITCAIIHGSYDIFNALNRSVETSEVLFIFNDNNSPLSVD